LRTISRFRRESWGWPRKSCFSASFSLAQIVRILPDLLLESGKGVTVPHGSHHFEETVGRQVSGHLVEFVFRGIQEEDGGVAPDIEFGLVPLSVGILVAIQLDPDEGVSQFLDHLGIGEGFRFHFPAITAPVRIQVQEHVPVFPGGGLEGCVYVGLPVYPASRGSFAPGT